MTQTTDAVLEFHAAELNRLPGIRHGFFGRKGGVSRGIYASLNCGPGSNDVAEDVRENRARVLRQLGTPTAPLYTLYQCHSADVVVLKTIPAEADERPKADALVTNLRNITIGILTADCTPVLFADDKAGVIGAAHAGWKGAIGGVLQNTVKEMEALGATRKNITAAIGPCIRQPSYEVGAEFKDTFVKKDAQNSRYFISGAAPEKYLFDLAEFVRTVLEELNLAAVGDVKKDTLAETENFFSYRRTCLAGEKDYGRQISAITLA